MSHECYECPLQTRYASAEMLRLFSPQRKFSSWREIWVSLATHEQALGVTRISDEALAEMRANVNNINFARASELEAVLGHDVMSHIHTFEEAAPAAKGIIHLGATSQFVVDNTNLILMREGLSMLAKRLVGIITVLSGFARKWKDFPTLGYTHLQAAQLTTVGKRACLWIQEFAMDLEEIEYRIKWMKFRGVKGTTGTQASFLTLFDGDHEKVKELDRRVTQDFSFDEAFPVTGQTYPRSVDARILSALASCAANVHKFCNDIRVLASFKQMEEPFGKKQVGSTAMAYKRNPKDSECATGLARFVMNLVPNALQNAALQMLERTLDDSSNWRNAIPPAFLAMDGCLKLVAKIVDGLVVYPKVIKASINAELSFMATEELLMDACNAGGDRQELHEIIRQCSQEAAAQVKMEGKPNDLLARLATYPAFAAIDLTASLDPKKFIGRASEQVDEFIADVVDPILQSHSVVEMI